MRTIIAALLLLCAQAARADATPQEDHAAKARELFEQAKIHFDLHEFDQALPLFREAYVHAHDPAFLFNMAQCARFLGKYADAIMYYKTFLRLGDITERQRKDVLERIAEMEEAAQKTLQDRPPQGMESPDAPKLPPPIAPLPLRQPEPRQTERRRVVDPIALSFASAGAASIIAGVALLIAAQHTRTLADMAPTATERFDQSGTALYEANAGYVCFGVAAAAVAVAAIRWATLPKHAPAISVGAGSASATWRW